MEIKVDEFGRLDKVLSNALNIPRNQIEALIKNSGVRVENEIITKSSYKLTRPSKIELEIPIITQMQSCYEVDFEVEVLYEDEDILVINKQPFLVVHGASSVKEATLVDWLRKRGVSLSTISGELRHGIVHRIDKETSGALVVAKNNEAHLSLSRQLEQREMGRYYLALIDSTLKQNCIVEKNIARNPKNRLKMGIVEEGRYAKSAFCGVLKSKNEEIELIAAKLFTGRTHQIRVHLNSIGKHILGDDLYGFKSKNNKIDRVMLHAYLLYLKHPKTGKMLYVKAPLFDDFVEILQTRFDKEEVYEKIDYDYILECFRDVHQWVSR